MARETSTNVTMFRHCGASLREYSMQTNDPEVEQQLSCSGHCELALTLVQNT